MLWDLIAWSWREILDQNHLQTLKETVNQKHQTFAKHNRPLIDREGVRIRENYSSTIWIEGEREREGKWKRVRLITQCSHVATTSQLSDECAAILSDHDYVEPRGWDLMTNMTNQTVQCSCGMSKMVHNNMTKQGSCSAVATRRDMSRCYVMWLRDMSRGIRTRSFWALPTIFWSISEAKNRLPRRLAEFQPIWRSVNLWTRFYEPLGSIMSHAGSLSHHFNLIYITSWPAVPEYWIRFVAVVYRIFRVLSS
jgi:hypothetical protein